MAKAKNPVTFSEEFGVPEKHLADLGVLNVTLAMDTALFIDPLLLERSGHPEINRAHDDYEAHFASIIGLLAASKYKGDPAWKGALRLMQFPEIRGTCLGYGAGSIDGTGFTGKLSERATAVAAEVVSIGVEDPDLFPLMAIFEDGIGPDRISDMVTNVAYAGLVAFNARVINQMGLTGEEFVNRKGPGVFVANPYELGRRTPIILVPTDIVRDLPIANDWDDVVAAIKHNDELRDEVNRHVAQLWERKTKRRKDILKAEALENHAAFIALLSAVQAASGKPYDVRSDPKGLISWAAIAKRFAAAHPLELHLEAGSKLDEVFGVVKAIVAQFRHLIEKAGLNKELYKEDGSPKHESTAQRLFFAVAYSYCKANNIDISPEIDTGTGKIDFKLSTGFEERVLVELKLSRNSSLPSGYTSQLQEYKAAQETVRAVYLVIDVGSMGAKQEKLIAIRNQATEQGAPLSELEFIDGGKKAPPSKL